MSFKKKFSILLGLVFLMCFGAGFVFAEFNASFGGSLAAPTTNTFDTDGSVNFICNFQTADEFINNTVNNTITNVTLYVWTQSSNNVSYNSSNLTSGIVANVTNGVNYTFTLTNLEDLAIVEWNCLAYNNGSFTQWGSNTSNSTVKIDKAPNASIIFSPLTGIWSNNLTISVNGSDGRINLTNAALNYTLYVNGTANRTGLHVNQTGLNITLGVGFLNHTAYSLILELSDNQSSKLNSSAFIFKYITYSEFESNSLQAPGTNTFDADGTVNLICNFKTGNLNSTLTNVSLWTNSSGSWNVSPVYSNTTSVVANVTNGVNFTFSPSFADKVSVNWSCLAYNNGSFSRWGDFNTVNYTVTMDTVAPNASTIISPPSNVWNNTFRLKVNASDQLDTFLNYTLYINGIANFTVTGVTSALGINASDPAGFNLSIDGKKLLNSTVYTLILEVEDNAGNKLNSSAHIFKHDNITATVNIRSPVNGTATAEPYVRVNASDGDDYLNYVIYVNGSAYAGNSSYTANETSGNASTNQVTTRDISGYLIPFTGLASGGSYNITIELIDDLGNKVNSTGVGGGGFIFKYDVGTSPFVGGGSGGGGSSTTTVTTQSVSLTNSEATYASLSTNSKLTFSVGGGSHTLTIKKVYSDRTKIDVVISSDPISATLEVGKEQIFTIGNEQLYVKLEKIEGGKADITIKKMPAQTTTPTKTTQPKAEEPKPAAQPTEQPSEKPAAAMPEKEAEETSSGLASMIIAIIVIIVIVAAIIFVVNKKKGN